MRRLTKNEEIYFNNIINNVDPIKNLKLLKNSLISSFQNGYLISNKDGGNWFDTIVGIKPLDSGTNQICLTNSEDDEYFYTEYIDDSSAIAVFDIDDVDNCEQFAYGDLDL